MLPFLCLFKTFLHCHPVDVFTKSYKKVTHVSDVFDTEQGTSDNNYMQNRSVQLEG